MEHVSSLGDVLNLIDRLVGIADKVVPLVMIVANYHRTKKEDSSMHGKQTDES